MAGERHFDLTRPPRDLDAAAPAVLRWWWAMWLLTGALVVLAMFMPAAAGADTATGWAIVDVINTPLSVLAIWLWWQVVTLITNLQKAARPAAPTNSAQEVLQ